MISKRKLINTHNNSCIYIELLSNEETYIVAVDKDGNESKVKFEDSVSYVSGNHKFSASFKNFRNLLLNNNQSLSIEEILSRADKCNKTITHYYGKNEKSEQIWGIRCLLCNHESKKFARWFDECSGCNNLNKVTCHDEFVKISNKIHNFRYLYDDIYVNTKFKINIFCTACKTFFKQIPQNHLKGSGCPRCNFSKGELRVEKYLLDNNINYIAQEEFNDLRHKKNLKLDFFCPDDKKIVEFDGEGHYNLDFYIGKRIKNPEKALADVKIRDEIKNAWAKANGYIMIRIPYWDFNRIEEILDGYFGAKHAK